MTDAVGDEQTPDFRRRIAQQEALAALGLEAVRTDDLAQIFLSSTNALRANLDAAGAAVVESLSDGETLQVRLINSDNPLLVPETIVRQGTLTALALANSDPVVTGDFAGDPRFAATDHPFASGVATPIRRHVGNFGVLVVFSRQLHAFSDPDVYFIRSVANMLSAVIEREEALSLASATLQAVPLALVIVDDENTIVESNEAAAQLFGTSRDALRGTSTASLSLDPGGSRARRETFLGGAADEVEFLGAGGERRRVLRSAVPNFQPGLHLLIGRDVTEQRRLEHELQQTQKMQVVGELAASIAHDFNNLLVAVRGLSSVVLDELEPGSSLRGDVEAIHQAGVRGIAVVSRLLAFARPPDVTEARVVRGADVIAEMRPFLRQLVRAEIDLAISLRTTSTALIDPRDLEQAVLNLVVNAQDAISGRGTIRIQIDERMIGASEAARLGIPPERYVVLTVADDGQGMDASTRARSLDPFFTTKQPGRGTGLGLPMALRVARTAGGTLTVDSRPDEGSAVSLFLPALDTEPVVTVRAEHPDVSSGGDETILVVDDDALVLRFADRALRRLGYAVVATTSSEQALAEAAQRPEIAAALLDVVMPVTGGRELAELLHQSRPDLKVCFMSAYTDVPRPDVLEKPFTEADLARAIRATIDGSD